MGLAAGYGEGRRRDRRALPGLGAAKRRCKIDAMKKALLLGCLLTIAGTTLTVSAAVSDKLKSRIEESATVLTEIHAAPDKDIPKYLWDRATCVVVIPSVKKVAFVFGGEYGRGLMACRKGGGW